MSSPTNPVKTPAPKPGAPEWLGLSPVIWLVLGGGVVLWLFIVWESRRLAHGAEPLVNPAMFGNPTLRAGLTSFFFQYLLQAGLFFTVPLFLSVALGLSAIATGIRLLPLSLTLLLAAVGVPKLFPDVSPRLIVRLGFLALFAGIVVMIGALQAGAGAEIVTWPMLLAGLGVGALASQLGSVTVSSVPDEQSSVVGGLQNTVTNLGASIGTALAGAVLIAALTTSVTAGIESNPAVPAEVKSKAKTDLADAGVPTDAANAIVDENATARLKALRSSLSVLAVFALLAVLLSFRIPTEQPAAESDPPATGLSGSPP